MRKRYVFFDLETTVPAKRGRPQIIQLAAVTFNDDGEFQDSIELKIVSNLRPLKQVQTRKRNYSEREWRAQGVCPQTAAKQFARFLWRGDYANQLVAHNAAFDAPLLHAWFKDVGVFLPARFHVLCTMQRAQWYFSERPTIERPRNFSLAALCQYFQVPFHAADAHDDLGDAKATADL